jgi:hypothetical protein
MADRREEILARLEAILEGLAQDMRDSTEDPRPRATAARGRLDFDESERPILLLLDGDEDADQASFGRNHPASAANIVSLQPEVYVMIEGKPEDVGTRLNELRALVVKAVLTDAQLLALAHNGDVRYDGCVTGLSIGRSMEGEAALNFTLNYVFRPTAL